MNRTFKGIICLIMLLVMIITPVPASELTETASQSEEILETEQKTAPETELETVPLTAPETAQSEGYYYLNKETKHMHIKSKCVLRVLGGAKKVKWRSSNKKVATVKKKSGNTAVVKAKKEGICKITAKAGNVTLQCVIQVMGSTRKTGVFKRGAFYIGRKKIYTIKKTLSASKADVDFKGAHYLFIGASRVRSTEDAVIDPDVYFCSYPGCGIDCMFKRMVFLNEKKPAGLRLIDSFLKKQPGGTVLIDLGGNDLWNKKAYVGLYRSLIYKYPSARFYFISILPRENRSNRKREIFNALLKKAFPLNFIDLYSFVLSHPNFETLDGTHYGPLLSRIIYENIMKQAGRNIAVNLQTGIVSPDIPQSDDTVIEYIEVIENMETEGGSESEGAGNNSGIISEKDDYLAETG